jgi:Flp pilus assembly protein TadB
VGETTEGIREGARELRGSMSRDKIEERAESMVEERPMVRHALNLRAVAIALAIAVVLTLIVGLLLSWKIGAIVLVLSFGIAWLVLSKRSYESRRPTRAADEDDESESESESS